VARNRARGVRVSGGIGYDRGRKYSSQPSSRPGRGAGVLALFPVSPEASMKDYSRRKPLDDLLKDPEKKKFSWRRRTCGVPDESAELWRARAWTGRKLAEQQRRGPVNATR